LLYITFTTSPAELEQDLLLLERELAVRGHPKPTAKVEPPGHAWRRRRRLHSRDLNVGRRGEERFKRTNSVILDEAGFPVALLEGHRWAVIEPLYGDEPDVGSFHVDNPDEPTDAERYQLMRAADEEIFGPELEFYLTADGIFCCPVSEDYSGEPIDGLENPELETPEEIEALMSTPPGEEAPTQWWLRYDERPADPGNLCPTRHGCRFFSFIEKI
jgi:hypothetical protein